MGDYTDFTDYFPNEPLGVEIFIVCVIIAY